MPRMQEAWQNEIHVSRYLGLPKVLYILAPFPSTVYCTCGDVRTLADHLSYNDLNTLHEICECAFKSQSP